MRTTATAKPRRMRIAPYFFNTSGRTPAAILSRSTLIVAICFSSAAILLRAASASLAMDLRSDSTSAARSAKTFSLASTASASLVISCSRFCTLSRVCSISRWAATYSREFLAADSFCLAPETEVSSVCSWLFWSL